MGAIFIRVILLYILVLASLRIMGKREIGQLQPFELAVTIMIADLASVPMQDIGIPLIQGIVPILAILAGQLFLAYINIKSGIVRKIMCGKPTVLIRKGKLLEEELKKQKYTLDELLEQIRVGGYPNIDTIEYAILETSGQISIIPKPESLNVTIGDMNLQTQYRGYSRPLVVDGAYIDKNIKDMGYERNWVDKKLKENNTKLEETFILVSDENGTVFCQKKNED